MHCDSSRLVLFFLLAANRPKMTILVSKKVVLNRPFEFLEELLQKFDQNEIVQTIKVKLLFVRLISDNLLAVNPFGLHAEKSMLHGLIVKFSFPFEGSHLVQSSSHCYI